MNDTNWLVSLLSNCFAVSFSYAIGMLVSKYLADKNEEFAINLLLVFISAFIVYFLVYLCFGYTPMGKTGKNIFQRLKVKRFMD